MLKEPIKDTLWQDPDRGSEMQEAKGKHLSNLNKHMPALWDKTTVMSPDVWNGGEGQCATGQRRGSCQMEGTSLRAFCCWRGGQRR